MEKLLKALRSGRIQHNKAELIVAYQARNLMSQVCGLMVVSFVCYYSPAKGKRNEAVREEKEATRRKQSQASVDFPMTPRQAQLESLYFLWEIGCLQRNHTIFSVKRLQLSLLQMDIGLP